jgi:hypothetical protein
MLQVLALFLCTEGCAIFENVVFLLQYILCSMHIQNSWSTVLLRRNFKCSNTSYFLWWFSHMHWEYTEQHWLRYFDFITWDESVSKKMVSMHYILTLYCILQRFVNKYINWLVNGCHPSFNDFVKDYMLFCLVCLHNPK